MINEARMVVYTKFLSVESPENVKTVKTFSNLEKRRILSKTKDVSVGQKCEMRKFISFKLCLNCIRYPKPKFKFRVFCQLEKIWSWTQDPE